MGEEDRCLPGYEGDAGVGNSPGRMRSLGPEGMTGTGRAPGEGQCPVKRPCCMMVSCLN